MIDAAWVSSLSFCILVFLISVLLKATGSLEASNCCLGKQMPREEF